MEGAGVLHLQNSHELRKPEITRKWALPYRKWALPYRKWALLSRKWALLSRK